MKEWSQPDNCAAVTPIRAAYEIGSSVGDDEQNDATTATVLPSLCREPFEFAVALSGWWARIELSSTENVRLHPRIADNAITKLDGRYALALATDSSIELHFAVEDDTEATSRRIGAFAYALASMLGDEISVSAQMIRLLPEQNA